MARKEKKPLPVVSGVQIESIAAEGQSIAHLDGEVLFVPYGAPGDVCTVQIVRRKRHFSEGRILSVDIPSPQRIEPVCPHFGTCGGCKWQHIPYSLQLQAKQQQVTDALTRIGGVSVDEQLPIIGADETYRYRNKVEFTFSNQRWVTFEEMEQHPDASPKSGLGFHIPGRFDKVLDIRECHLITETTNRIRDAVRELTLPHPEQYPYFNLKAQDGMMRTMMLRSNQAGDIMLLLAFAEDNQAAREQLLSALAKRFPEIKSLLWLVNTKANDTFNDLPVYCFSGADHINEQLGDLSFKIGAKSFFQTNTRQTLKLYNVVKQFATPQKDDIVYDLYSGTGTITNWVARECRKAIGIEYVPEAVEDAWENSRINGITNTLFFAGDMKDLLTPELFAEHGKPDVIIVDPPRAGMHPSVVETIIAAHPAKLVYVSCNPATQARDAALLVAGGYRIVRSQPVDMFPQTHHVENVLLFIPHET